jgi:hypothetical protein
MEPVRPLRDVFADLADHTDHSDPMAGPDGPAPAPADPRSLLADYADLPDDLLVTAIDSYANTAPAEVAEHLAAFVATPGADPADGLDLLASAPVGVWEGEVPVAGPENPEDDFEDTGLDGADLVNAGTTDLGDGPALDLDHLGWADSLDLAETSPADDGFGNQVDDLQASVGSEERTAQDVTDRIDHPADPALGSDQNGEEAVDQTGPDTGMDSGMDEGTGLDEDSADSHDYLDRLADQPAALDELDDVQNFDEFDA